MNEALPRQPPTRWTRPSILPDSFSVLAAHSRVAAGIEQIHGRSAHHGPGVGLPGALDDFGEAAGVRVGRDDRGTRPRQAQYRCPSGRACRAGHGDHRTVQRSGVRTVHRRLLRT